MKRLDTTQFLVWIALGAVAFVFLKWRQTALPDLTERVEAPELSGRVPLGRLDSLPKPFARLRLPGTRSPRSTSVLPPPALPPVRPPVARRLRADPGEAVVVSVTAYCLQGRTRLGTKVREGIVAADPRVFPLSSQIDLIVAKDTLRGLTVEDTGLLIKGRIIDLWLSDCSMARRFGRKRGTATLIPKIRR